MMCEYCFLDFKKLFEMEGMAHPMGENKFWLCEQCSTDEMIQKNYTGLAFKTGKIRESN